MIRLAGRGVAFLAAMLAVAAAVFLLRAARGPERLALSKVEGLALSNVEGLALSEVEGLALSEVEGSAPQGPESAPPFQRSAAQGARAAGAYGTPPLSATVIVPPSSPPPDPPAATPFGALARPVPTAAAGDMAPLTTGLNDVQMVVTCRPDAGALSTADAIQQCIDHAPAFSSVDIAPGIYVLQKQLVVSTPLTIRTAGSANGSLSCVDDPGRCAVLMAGQRLLDPYGVLLVRSTSNVTLEHVVIDGNRAARLSSVAAQWCPGFNATVGFNAGVLECAGCGLNDVVSRNALCGSGMVWSGPRALIQRSAFVANGDATTQGMWADGLTLLYAPDSEIRLNQFVDNSDVALILGYGVRTRVERNVIVQRAQQVFAGLMLHNFDSNDLSFRGDFRDAVIADNIINCGVQLCVFGIQVGPRPWDATQNIIGGDLHGNTISGAKVGINVDGAGIAGAPIRIFANAVSNVPAASYFSACAQGIPTDWMNVAPTSVVDRHDELSTTGEHLSDSCQLMSALAPDAP